MWKQLVKLAHLPLNQISRGQLLQKNNLLSISASIVSWTLDTEDGIAALVKYLRVGNWCLELNFWSMVQNPGLSTVDKGSISLAKQEATDFINSLCSLDNVDSSFCLSHTVARDGWSSGTLSIFRPFSLVCYTTEYSYWVLMLEVVV